MIVYVAGPYRADTHEGIDTNIANARKVAIELWEAGHVALCPHLNTAHFEVDCKVPNEVYLQGDLLLLDKCDAIVLIPGWEDSEGAIGELVHALANGIPVHVYPGVPEKRE